MKFDIFQFVVHNHGGLRSGCGIEYIKTFIYSIISHVIFLLMLEMQEAEQRPEGCLSRPTRGG
jgi:hypothetical protein